MSPAARPAQLRFLAAAVALAAGGVVPLAAAAQDGPIASQLASALLAEGSGAESQAGKPAIALDVDLSVAETPFFTRDPLGFDAGTLAGLPRAIGAATAASIDAARSDGMLSASLAAMALGLFAVLVVVDRRLRRAVADATATRAPATRFVMALAAAACMPIAAAGVAAGPLAGVGLGAAWVGWLRDASLMVAAYAVVAQAARVALLDNVFSLAARSATALGRALRWVGLGVLLGGLVWVTARRAKAPADVQALCDEITRLTLLGGGVWLYSARRHLMAIMPDEGSPAYLRARAIVVGAVRAFLLFAIALLVLWSLGFNRAATTVLVRSMSLAVLFVVVALGRRWFDGAASEPDGTGLSHALVREVDGFVRACGYAGLGIAVLALLGLLGPLVHLLDAARLSVGAYGLSLLAAARGVLLAIAAVLIGRVVRFSLEQVVFPRFEVDVGVGYAITTAVNYAVAGLAIGLAFIGLGLDARTMTVFIGALGVGVGFGLQDFARNMVSGFVLLFGRVVRKGDLVTVAERYLGTVEEIGARMVRIRTRDNTDLVVPASDVVSSALVNWTHDSPVIRIHVPVGVSYGSDAHEVRAALLVAADRFPGALKVPEPDVWLIGFGESALEFELLVWVDARVLDPFSTRGMLMYFVWDVLKEMHIEIPFPQRDLHLRSVSPGAAEALRTLTPPDPGARAPRG